jgi:hypothetical protein
MSQSVLSILTHDGFTLCALGAKDDTNADSDFVVEKVQLKRAEGKTATITVDTSATIQCVVPGRLLLKNAEQYVLRTSAEGADAIPSEEWSALRDRLRRRLAQPLVVKDKSEFFGITKIAGAETTARLWLMPVVLDGVDAIADDAVVLRAEAVADVTVDVDLGTDHAALDGRWRIDVEVRKAAVEDAVAALFDVRLPAMPALYLDWPRMPLPALTFSGWEFPIFGAFPSFFALSLPKVDAQLAFDPNPSQPSIKLTVTDGNVTVATMPAADGAATGGGTLKYGVTEVCKVSDVAFSYDSGTSQHQFKATLAPAAVAMKAQSLKFPAAGGIELPFSVTIETFETQIVFAPIKIGQNGPTTQSPTLTHTLTAVRIAARDDPSQFIVLNATFETKLHPDGGVHTTLAQLALVEPYPLTLVVNAVEAVGELVRLIAAIPLPQSGLPGVDVQKLTALLARLGRMLASAMAWLAKQAGAAAGVLAGVVEAVARMFGQMLEMLAVAAADVFKVVCIEVRLDPRSYQIRQIVITPANDQAVVAWDVATTVLGVEFAFDARMKPSLLIDLGPESWFGLLAEPEPGAKASLKTDFWLDKQTGPQQPLGTMRAENDPPNPPRLIELTAEVGQGTGTPPEARRDIVIAAVQRGRLRLFQKFVARGDRAGQVTVDTGAATFTLLSRHASGSLEPAVIGADAASADIVLTSAVGNVEKRILGLLSKPKGDATGNSWSDLLAQKVTIEAKGQPELKDRTLTIGLTLIVHIDANFSPKAEFVATVSLDDLSATITGGDRIAIRGTEDQHYQPLGFDLTVRRKTPTTANPALPYTQFYIDLSSGRESLALAEDEAVAELSYGRVASEGKGLQFELSRLEISRAGIDLDARVLPEPVRLGGVDMPFTFTSGQVAIRGSRFTGGSLIGAGQLPNALIGEANASIALTLGRDSGNGDVVVEAATALIDKSGDPIRCHSTRFDITITELGFSFVREGNYHFYFLVTGSARFSPGAGEFADGLLKNLNSLEIRFDKAPLAKDPRVLTRSMSFLVTLKPPVTTKLFNIFQFELRSIAFYPAAEKFDGQPAMGFGGQVKFLEGGDTVSAKVNFHEMLVGPPRSGELLPRIRFDGLEVGISLSGVKVSGMAITVDGDLPSLYRPGTLPKNVSAKGFLASGTLEVKGWAPMSATLGFLELKNKEEPSVPPRHAFFFYGQVSKLSAPIDTPVGSIYLREVGFGFGYRYTLGGIARAQKADTPKQLLAVLDEVSKYQGSLDRFESWEPTYDNADLTLALRGMLALSAAQRGGTDYNAAREAELPNPLLFDIVAALRTDLTILINLRAWLCVNYHTWVTAGADEEWKRNPVFRGYLYFSAPKREFLGRFISNGNGFIGEKPQLPAPLKSAIQGSKFSAILYIRPGLFHFELGWPYELGFDLGKRGDLFFLQVRGGLIHRVDDAGILMGIAFKAYGEVHLEGRVGSDSFGAAAIAHASFDVESRILSYLSLRNLDESMYYGYLRIDMVIDARVEVWLSFKIFGKSIKLSAGFSIQLAVSLAIEAVITPKALGGRAHASIGIQAFGRTASVGVGFSINDGLLNQARARVAGFMALGMSAPVPDASQDGRRLESNPLPEPSRHEVAAIADKTIEQDLGAIAAPEVVEGVLLTGRPMTVTDFWAMLVPTTRVEKPDEEWYVMQLVPRDHTPIGEKAPNLERSTFFASPKTADVAENQVEAAGPRLRLDPTKTWHQLRGTADLPDTAGLNDDEFCRLQVEEPPVAVKLQADTPTEEYRTNVGALIGSDHTLGDLLYGLFLDPIGPNAYLTEPQPRTIDLNELTLDDDSKASAMTLARHGRSRMHLSALRKREAEVEEARSAVLASVVDSAARLAAQGVDPTPPRHVDVDARDVGLTFLVSRPALYLLFPCLKKAEGTGDVTSPPSAAFQVKKSDAEGWGHVHLFNPPSRMFREAQPRFTPTHRVTEQGIMLDWDLEPSWGSSEGAYHDPEFHLRHYRIRRTIRGVNDNEYRAEFVVKAGAPMKLAWNGQKDATTVTFVRPPFQFIDDLRRAGSGSDASVIPESLRAALLGLKQPSEDEPFHRADILYEIVPVDVAGTSDVGEAYVVPIEPIGAPPQVSPRQAVLQLTCEAPVSPEGLVVLKPKLPTPLFLIAPTPEPHQATCAFHLRVLTELVESLGTYGSDALEQAGRFDEQAIERLGGDDDDVLDFVFALKVGAEGDPFVFQSEERDVDGSRLREDDPKLLPFHYKVTWKRKLVDGKLEEVDLEQSLRDVLLGTDKPGRAHRFFLRRLSKARPVAEDLKASGTHGEWRSVLVNLVIKRDAEPKPKELKPNEPKPKEPMPAGPINATLEAFEWPRDLRFMALSVTDGDADRKSGRLHLVYPPIEGTLEHLEANGELPTMRDPERRTATRLSWKVNASSLVMSDDKPDDQPNNADDKKTNRYRWIGGYDVHVVDPDALPPRRENDDGPGAAVREQLTEAARLVGRVALMPASFDGLEPSGFGDLGRLEAAYPSDTLRLQGRSQESGVRRAAWYSPAESTVVFPQPSIRRSLMPDPDEALIASLFAQGKPDALRILIPAWSDDAADPLLDWRLAFLVGKGTDGPTYGDYVAGDPHAPKPDEATRTKKSVCCVKAGGFTVAQVRQLLQNLRLAPEDKRIASAYQQEANALWRRVDDPTYLASVTVRLEVMRARAGAPEGLTTPKDLVLVATFDHVVDLAPPLHPVLADTLAFLPYAPQDGFEIKDGKVYRRYSIVSDPDPEVKAKSFADWVDEAPPQRDPYGWGALRTLGLARGLRVYDTVAGRYVRGRELLQCVRVAMTRALRRYTDTAGQGRRGTGRFNGQPFVDLLTKPWGNAKLFWPDGGSEPLADSDQSKFIENDFLAVVQIALRPAPDRVARSLGIEARLVRYFAITVKVDDVTGGAWSLTRSTTGLSGHIDVVGLSGGFETNHTIRLKVGESHTFRVSGSVHTVRRRTAIALVRTVVDRYLTAGQVKQALTLTLTKPSKDGTPGSPRLEGFRCREIVDPIVQKPSPDRAVPAYGRFEALKGADWEYALFRPTVTNDAVELSPVRAFDHLAGYLTRRFGPLTVAQGVPAAHPENPGLFIESAAARGQRADLASVIVRFWARFLDHCAPKPGGSTTIAFSIGTVADPGVWRCAPDPSGFVSIVIPDADRRGARRKFAIRPYGRYESWIKACHVKRDDAGAPATLSGALHTVEQGLANQFLDVTLPRTEPIEKPVILAAQRRRPDTGDKNEKIDFNRIEIVVAHGTDMVLGQANRRNEAMLAPLDISVGYAREFPHGPWVKGLGHGAWNYSAEFGSSKNGNVALPALEERTAELRLEELRKQVPDAWLGATLVSAASPPYFFRTYADVHASAGIVVSDSTRAVFEEGFAERYFPFDKATGYGYRTQSSLPTYSVARPNGETIITFDLALHRFVDCMPALEAVLWFGKGGEHWGGIKDVVHLPEPGISYRIAVEAVVPDTEEAVARTIEFDLSPVTDTVEGKPRSQYLVQSRGQVLGIPGGAIAPRQAPGPDGNPHNWRLTLKTEPKNAEASASLSRAISDAELKVMEACLAGQEVADGETMTIDALRHYTLTCAWVPAEVDWTPLWDAALAALASSPEARGILERWKSPPAQDDTLTLPVSYPARVQFEALTTLEALCHAAPVEEPRHLLVLRRPPIDDELKVFKPAPGATETQRNLWKRLLSLAATQLFGPERRAVVLATKGAMPPVHHPIRRGIEGEGA